MRHPAEILHSCVLGCKDKWIQKEKNPEFYLETSYVCEVMSEMCNSLLYGVSLICEWLHVLMYGGFSGHCFKKKRQKKTQGHSRIDWMLLDWIIVHCGFSFPTSACFNPNRTLVIVAVKSHQSASSLHCQDCAWCGRMWWSARTWVDV